MPYEQLNHLIEHHNMFSMHKNSNRFKVIYNIENNKTRFNFYNVTLKNKKLINVTNIRYLSVINIINVLK